MRARVKVEAFADFGPAPTIALEAFAKLDETASGFQASVDVHDGQRPGMPAETRELLEVASEWGSLEAVELLASRVLANGEEEVPEPVKLAALVGAAALRALAVAVAPTVPAPPPEPEPVSVRPPERSSLPEPMPAPVGVDGEGLEVDVEPGGDPRRVVCCMSCGADVLAGEALMVAVDVPVSARPEDGGLEALVCGFPCMASALVVAIGAAHDMGDRRAPSAGPARFRPPATVLEVPLEVPRAAAGVPS